MNPLGVNLTDVWTDIPHCDVIIERLTEGNLHYHKNNDSVN
ncbi:hypothetical protein [Planktothrix agardhii]|uniref:Modification methylase BamHI n=3 Tax=Planktothrix agardhii TaxID=1160 RepID=A0AAD1Q050_PLAAG|nr:hypothetical protein [Planktothrix agardhii]CAD5927838.1 Modification methylase BamHI [Planktothrix agardhii]